MYIIGCGGIRDNHGATTHLPLVYPFLTTASALNRSLVCKTDFAKYTIIKILLNLFASLPLKKRAKLRFFFEMCKFLRVYMRA